MPRVKLDLLTLNALRVEAASQHAQYARLFQKHDNSDDMHEMETWDAIVVWLDQKIGEHRG